MRYSRALLLFSVACAGLVAAGAAGAGATVNQTTPFAITMFSDCTGEPVALEGNLHTVVHLGESGDRTHFGEDFHATGMKGGGLLTGAEYVQTDVQNSQGNTTLLGPQEATTEQTINLTRLGEDKIYGNGDDMRVRIFIHVTVNANGIVTVEKTDARNECV